MIPVKLNAALLVFIVAALSGLLLFATHLELPWLLACAAVFAILHFTSYCLLHEAEHGMLLPNKQWNNAAGIVLGFFFPAPFSLLRQ